MLTLAGFLKLNQGNHVQVCVKEPDKCANYWTTLENGESNNHTNFDLEREVYSIGVIYKKKFNGNI